MAKKKKGDGGGGGGGHDTAGGLRWLLTYADMITLLLGVFIILATIPTQSKEKLTKIGESLAKYFNVLEGPGGQKILTEKGGQGLFEKRTVPYGRSHNPDKSSDIKMPLIQAFHSEIKNKKVAIEETKKGLVIRFRDTFLFDPGDAIVKTDACYALSKIAVFIEGKPNYVSIEGHTSSASEKGIFRSSWELSARRATAVLHYLCNHALEKGFSEAAMKSLQERLSATGYGEFHPLNPDPASPVNRRVEIIILHQKVKGKDLLL
ncbi:flagellar motor protein MotB [Candidatus Desantisbacteria bacterium]|nr:flagellar motor protein MotB [Candidatus Desantisbacteria bacterium]